MVSNGASSRMIEEESQLIFSEGVQLPMSIDSICDKAFLMYRIHCDYLQRNL